MIAVAAGDKVAGQFMRMAVVGESDLRVGRCEIVNAYVFDLEEDGSSGGEPRLDQIFDQLMLGVDRNPAAAGEILEIDAMAVATEP